MTEGKKLRSSEESAKATELTGAGQLLPAAALRTSLSPPACLPHCPRSNGQTHSRLILTLQQASREDLKMRDQEGLAGTWSLHPIKPGFLLSQLPPLQSRAIISTQDEGCQNEG